MPDRAGLIGIGLGFALLTGLTAATAVTVVAQAVTTADGGVAADDGYHVTRPTSLASVAPHMLSRSGGEERVHGRAQP